MPGCSKGYGDPVGRQLVDGEVAIIITTDGISVYPEADKVMEFRDQDQ